MTVILTINFSDEVLDALRRSKSITIALAPTGRGRVGRAFRAAPGTRAKAGA